MRLEIISNTLNRLLFALLMKSWFLPRKGIEFVFCQNMVRVMFNFKLLGYRRGKHFYTAQIGRGIHVHHRVKDLTWKSLSGFLSA